MKEYDNVKDAVIDLVNYSTGVWYDAKTGEVNQADQVIEINEIACQLAELLGIDVDAEIERRENSDLKKEEIKKFLHAIEKTLTE